MVLAGSTEASCPSCDTIGTVVGVSRGADVYRCPVCRLCYLSASIRLNAERDNHWYADCQNADASRFLADMKEAYTRQLSILEGLTTGRSLIDVGAGLGIFLKVAKDRGWDAHGAETSEHAARFAASRFGIRYHSRLPAAQFDIVRISHVLEHIPDPAEFVVQLREVTKPSGILAVIMPNREPLCASMINRIRRLRSPAPKLAGAIYPDMHVLGFSPGSLAHLVVRCGFKRMSVATVSMGNRTFFPLFYDGLLTRIPLHQIRLKEFVRYYLPMLVDNVGNRFGKGQWIVAYFQAT